MKNQRVQAEIIRKPGSVFVGIQPPEKLQQTMAASAQPRVWAQVAQTIATEERAMNRTTTSQEDIPTPEPTPKLYPERHAKQPRLYDYEGRPAMAVAKADNFLECQELADKPNDPKTWHGACQSAARRAARHSHTMDECVKYVVIAAHCFNKAERLEGREIVEVHNAETGDLIWIGLSHDGFDKRCRTYADKTGTGLRVDFTSENRSQFYTPRSEQLRYGRENAKHFAKKYGVPVADAVGVVAIVGVSWLALIVCGGVV